jgi:bifunctional DNA-binding transcriptional regulator/antitoxin component of YhaV-PrlF toxin-antitoxin module
MRRLEATITSQGQVTVPVEVRRALGVEKREKVVFVIGTDGIRLERLPFTLETAFGAVPAIPGVSPDFDREIEEAMEDHADRVVERMRAT